MLPREGLKKGIKPGADRKQEKIGRTQTFKLAQLRRVSGQFRPVPSSAGRALSSYTSLFDFISRRAGIFKLRSPHVFLNTRLTLHTAAIGISNA